MTRWDFRALLSKTLNTRAMKRVSLIGRLTKRAGRALGTDGYTPMSAEGLTALEDRRMMDGDFGTAVEVVLDVAGRGSEAGSISPVIAGSDNDYFRFVAPVDGFVSVLADTRNELVASTLNTRVTIFNSAQAQIATGTNNGVLTSGTATDGWAGFVATAGETYFVVVSREAGSGDYTLQVNAENVGFEIADTDQIVPAFAGIARELGSGVPDGFLIPITPIQGTLERVQQDIVYRYDVPDRDDFDSLVTVNAQVTQQDLTIRLDSRIDIYKQSDVTGAVTRVAFDSDAGRLNDSFTTFKAAPGETYFIRVRSDEIQAARSDFGTGTFFLVLDGVATDLPMNHVTRRGNTADAFVGFGDPSAAPPAPFPAVDPPVFQVNAHVFESQGNGLTITNASGTGLDPVNDPAMSLFNSTGARLAFNDNFAGVNPQFQVQLQGGNSYFVIVDGFEISGGTQYLLFNESNHTFDATQPNDDHINSNYGDQQPAVDEGVLRNLAKATPLVWGDPFNTFDGDGNLVRDIGMRVSATGEGRIHANGDTDVFKITVPVNQLGTYAGNNDDNGGSLFIGGAFTRAGLNFVYPTVSRNLAVWDANDYWYTGLQQFDPNDGTQYGFTDNPDTATTDSAIIHTMLDWDPTPGVDTAPTGMTDHVLVVGGDFILTIPSPFGPVVMQNLAIWVQDFNTGEFGWNNALGDLDGPVRAAVTIDEVVPPGVDPAPDDPTPYLALGGEFTGGATGFDPNLGFFDMGLPVGSRVYAMTVADLADPGAGLADTQNEIQTVTLTGNPTGGTFRLTLGADTTGPIAFNADAATVQAALEALPGVGAGNVTVTGGPLPGTPLTIEFTGALAGNDLPQMTATDNLTPLPAGITIATTQNGVPPVADPVDGPVKLYLGGEFAGQDDRGLNFQNIASFSIFTGVRSVFEGAGVVPGDPDPNPPLYAVDFGVVNGPVHALTTFDDPSWDPDVDDEAPATVVVLGGEFTDAGGNLVSNITAFGYPVPSALTDNEPVPVADQHLSWDPDAIGGGFNGPVHALATWDPPEINNTTEVTQRILLIGGEFDDRLANIDAYDGENFDLGFFGEGTDGPVFAITTVLDDQEVLIADDLLGGTDQQEVVYIGGQFENVLPGGGNPPVRVNNVAQWSAFHNNAFNVDFFAYRGMAGGIDTNVEADFGPTTGADAEDPVDFDPGVHALAFFDDGNPLRFDRHDRPSSRLDVVVNSAFGGVGNLLVRVFDSEGIIVYDFNKPGSDDRNPFNDPTDDPGMWDPAVLDPGTVTALQDRMGIQVWGGETYYIEVSRGGTGRYTVTATVDANPTDLNGDGIFDHVNGSLDEESFDGDFTRAIDINTTIGTGDGTNLVDADTQPFHGNEVRSQRIAPAARTNIRWSSDLGIINTIDDTDLYSFRAEFTGTVEVRVQTREIQTTAGESLVTLNALGEALAEEFNGSQRTMRSSLDSALRIFNNDFVQIGYNDNNYAIRGEFGASTVGNEAGEFTRKDGMHVFNVVAGNLYYMQVESGQFYVDGSAEDPAERTQNIEREIDWGSALGAYRLLIHQMPQQLNDVINGAEVEDDHEDLVQAQATVIPMNQVLGAGGNGTGTVTGRILNMNTSPVIAGGERRDTDLFWVTATGSGTMTIRVTATSGTLVPQVQTTTPVIVNGQAQQNGSVLLTLDDVFAGERYGFFVRGSGTTEGTYRVDVISQPAVDDHTDQGKWAGATDLILRDFLGTGNSSGSIEVPGDTDVFRFEAKSYATLTLNVVGLDATLDPMVEVFEVSEDGNAHSLYLRIGQNDDANVNTTNSRVRFPVGPDRRIDLDPPGEGVEDRVYPYYYIVVKSADPLAGSGRYTLDVQFAPTDDFADGDPDLDGIYDTGEYAFAHRVNIDSNSGAGEITGLIETVTDSDLFVFTPVASGVSTLIVTGLNGSILRGRISLLDSDANVLAQSTADDLAEFNSAFITADLDRGVSYYVVIDGFEDPLNPNVQTTKTGAYSLSINTPPLDDYPNIREFTLAHNIGINGTTGDGRIGGTAFGDPSNAELLPTSDTDLFTFSAIRAGDVVVTVTQFNHITGTFGARVRIYDSTQTLISDTSASSTGTAVSTTITGVTLGARYYILVSAVSGLPGSTDTGEYSVLVDGPSPDVPPPPPDPADIDFDAPVVLELDGRTGDAKGNYAIDVVNDRDLFKFTPLASGRTFVQLVAPNGSVLRASLRILNAANEEISSEVQFDSAGIPGAIANIAFDGVAGQDYWIVVDGLGDSTGGYTICVNTIPTLNRLYFPEGFSTSGIREFVSIVNPNSVDVTYTVRLKYEDQSIADTVISGNRILANSRDGLTLTNAEFYQVPGLVLGQAYSVVIESSAPLGATLAHYDFGTSIGDSFTESVARTWNFAQVERREGSALDFIVFHNPSPFDIIVTLTAYQSGQAPVQVRAVYFADRRGGFALTGSIRDFITGQDVQLPTGDFSVVLTATPANPADDAAFDGIVASLSHYNLGEGSGYAVLGDPDGGATEGVVTNVLASSTAESTVTFFNPADQPATLTIRGSYIRSSLPQFTRNVQVPARGQLVMTGSDLGLVADQPAGLTYSSDRALSVTFSTSQLGDADGVAASDMAGTRFYFGDAFIDVAKAGTEYFETLFLHNPSSIATTVTIKLLFLDGTDDSFTVNITGGGFAEVKLHERPEIVNQRTGYQWFAVDASAATPFVMSMTHYDLFLGGGWATQGTPFGLLNDISKIS